MMGGRYDQKELANCLAGMTNAGNTATELLKNRCTF